MYAVNWWFYIKLIIYYFSEKYDYVGRLLKPGEAPNNYSDEEEEATSTETSEKPKDEWIFCVAWFKKYCTYRYARLFTDYSHY